MLKLSVVKNYAYLADKTSELLPKVWHPRVWVEPRLHYKKKRLSKPVNSCSQFDDLLYKMNVYQILVFKKVYQFQIYHFF